MSSGPVEATLLTTVVSLDPVYAYFDAGIEASIPPIHSALAHAYGFGMRRVALIIALPLMP